MKAICICGEPGSTAHPYRVDHLVQALTSLGIESSWMSIPEGLQRLAEIAKADLMFLWRTAWDGSVSEIVRTARSNDATIIFDADDIVIEPGLARIEIIDGIRTQQLSEEEVERYFQRTLAAFEASDFACCSTEEIAGFMRARNKTVFVLPNGFDDALQARSRLVALRRRETSGDGLLRIGYATGTRSHQRDFAVAAAPLAATLRARPRCRLVLFRDLLDLGEFRDLQGLEQQIEWRTFVPHAELPDEMGRFDINLAPLEIGNPFCESKSELKFVQAALVEVCTVASPTGPFRRALRHNENGVLAEDPSAWSAALLRLVDDSQLRRRLGSASYHDVIIRYGPSRRRELISQMLSLWRSDIGSRHKPNIR